MAFAPSLRPGCDPTRLHRAAHRPASLCSVRRLARRHNARRPARAWHATADATTASAPSSPGPGDDGAAASFCAKCGCRTEPLVPADDNRMRAVCISPTCGVVHYDNPKVVVGAVATTRDGQRVVLTRRAIAPRVGSWTIPAGFLEVGETAEDGARRETLEEAGVDAAMSPVTLLAVYNILPANQVQLVYRASVPDEVAPEAGPEASEARLFEWHLIPWDELAFPTVEWALRFAREHVGREVLQPDLRTR